jgi:glucose-6-phosphate-specific signal transduction histidine kinase
MARERCSEGRASTWPPAWESCATWLAGSIRVAKHAQADAVSVEVEGGGGTVAVTIADDGVGGADAAAGSGLTGLADRVNAVGGRLEVSSARGEGTRIRAVLPTNVLGSLNGS